MKPEIDMSATLMAIDPTITIGTALATATGAVFGQLGGITVQRPDDRRQYTYHQYRIDLKPGARVEYRDEPRATLAVFPVDAVLAVRDTTPSFHPISEHYLGFSDRTWE